MNQGSTDHLCLTPVTSLAEAEAQAPRQAHSVALILEG